MSEKKLIAAIERFNASRPEDDPHYQAAADASVIFSGWFAAHQALHEVAGVDGLPQLKKVLELSKLRPDSHVMKTDIARVSQFYVTKWSTVPVPAK